MKKCPFCAEEIQEAAIKCRHCGEFLKDVVITSSAPDAETPVRELRPSVKSYLGPFLWWLVCVLVLSSMIEGYLQVLDLPAPSGGGMTGLLMGGFLLWAGLDYAARKYTITSQRVTARRGIVSRKIDEIQIAHIRSTNVRQGIWARLLGYGDLMLGTAGVAGVELTMTKVDDPEGIKDMLRAQLFLGARKGRKDE